MVQYTEDPLQTCTGFDNCICPVQVQVVTIYSWRIKYKFIYCQYAGLCICKLTLFYITLHKYVLNKLIFSQWSCKLSPGEGFKVDCLPDSAVRMSGCPEDDKSETAFSSYTEAK